MYFKINMINNNSVKFFLWISIEVKLKSKEFLENVIKIRTTTRILIISFNKLYIHLFKMFRVNLK